ncbi:MAG: FAD/NAD(P)-binding protein [Alphaproteobacteria bacterium]|nr:FAD/NAD(P)-binding protein [Alphaproteobacteria bacterium]
MGWYDIAIVGGGFSGVATIANIVRDAAKPIAIAVVSRDARGVFGPAYATPRDEHLLNVPAANMGLFADNPRHFYEWTQAQGITAAPGDYLPRRLYAQYLQSVLDAAQAAARDKGIRIGWFQGEAEDIEDHAEYLSVRSGGDGIDARVVVLAIGNALHKGDAGPAIDQPWKFDFKTLSPAQKKIALIGSGLTAADIIISILDTGWQGDITCYSGHAALPRAHLAGYDADKRVALPPDQYISQRLSGIMQALRREIKSGAREWHYIIDSLRPLTQDIWRSLSATDRERLVKKYFTLWNIHRHRYAPHIAARIDAAQAGGQLKMVKARVASAAQTPDGVALELATKDGVETAAGFDLVFRCTGVDYKTAHNPLLKNIIAKGLAKPPGNDYGIRASDNMLVYRDRPCAMYALGAPLFGALFETTAVPELRLQAKLISDSFLEDSIASKSRAIG